MEKLNMKTPDLTEKNILRLGTLFPEVITEIRDEQGNLTKGIDFDLLRQKLSSVLVEGTDERYRLDWPGKKASLVKANTPITKTLRPVIEESVDFENTQNLYIEGDNFEALKILQESYLGKVKMIYIDPPYNTGNDFIYKDSFKVGEKQYDEEIGVYNEEGGRMFKNTDSNGRFHSDWLSMMYERLVISRDLLKDDGVIFISIDDNEQAGLKLLCDDIFGEENNVTQLIIQGFANESNEGVLFQNVTEYCLCYAKDKTKTIIKKIDPVNKDLRSLNDAPSGLSTRKKMGFTIYFNPVSQDFIPKIDYDIYGDFSDLEKIYIDDSDLIKKGYIAIRPTPRNGVAWRWRWGLETLMERKEEIVFRQNRNGNWIVEFGQSGFNAPRDYQEFGTGTAEVKKMFNGIEVFTKPKSTEFIEFLIQVSSNDNDIILDFFSGSCTTAHAVMELNSELTTYNRFIMVQIPEYTDQKSEANKAGYKTIADIGKERIRRAGKKIKEESLADLRKQLAELDKKTQQGSLLEDEDSGQKRAEIEQKIKHIENLDIGFRVYKVDSSNMKDVYYHPSEVKQEQLSSFTSNIKEDRTAEDILTQVILDLGLELSLKIEKKKIRANDVFFVQENSLVACFDETIDFSIIDTIAQIKPLKVVFRDSGFKEDKDRINLAERFKRLSPETSIRVI